MIRSGEKRNLTIKLDRETIRTAKMLASRRSISLSVLVAQRIERIFGEEESYECAERQARKLLARGFHLGGGVRVGRDELHERKRGRVGPIQRTWVESSTSGKSGPPEGGPYEIKIK